MLGLKQVHHIAIIATDYAVSKAFYCDILGFTLQSEVYREARDSWKGDLALNGQYVIEAVEAAGHFRSRRSAPADRKLAACVIWLLALMTSMRQWRTLKAIT